MLEEEPVVLWAAGLMKGREPSQTAAMAHQR